jgi:hypothetical protein
MSLKAKMIRSVQPNTNRIVTSKSFSIKKKKQKAPQRSSLRLSLAGVKSARAPKRRQWSQSVPKGISMVTDGANFGSVWKNTTAERVSFPLSREKVADLTSASTAFAVLSQLYVNPANSTLFPIFSQIASCYEEYVPNVLRFYYRSEEYMASGSTVSAGLVGLGTNFDANDANYPNITTLENYEHAVSGPPFSGILCHDVVAEHRKRFRGKNRDLSINNYYCYPSANSIGPSTDQAKWYDMGNFQLVINGCQAGIIGELWVEYSFTMIRRKQPEFPIGGSAIHLKSYADDATAASPLGLSPYTTMSAASSGASVSGVAPGSTLSVINMAGDLSLYTGNTIGLNNATDTLLNLPNVSATWFVYFAWYDAAGIAAVPAIAASGGATSVAVIQGATGLLGFFNADGQSSSVSKVITTTATATPTTASNLLTLSGNTSMTSGDLDIYIIRIPNALITSVLPPLGFDSLIQRLSLLEQSLHRSRSSTHNVECKEQKDTSGALSLSDDDTIHVEPDLSASYISRIGDALGVPRTSLKRDFRPIH